MGFLAATIIATSLSDANAGCPVGYTYIGGSCYKTKGVDCEVDLKKLGNVTQHPKSLACNINPPGTDGVVQGVLFCGNPASNQPPGQVPAVFSCEPGSACFTNSTAVDPNSVKQGKAHVQVIVMPTQSELDSLALQYCPNTQFIGLDFVPCAFGGDLELTDDSGTVESVRHSCTLPDCFNLRWDKKKKMPEQRDYECTAAQ
jgi:hypothetical protein